MRHYAIFIDGKADLLCGASEKEDVTLSWHMVNCVACLAQQIENLTLMMERKEG